MCFQSKKRFKKIWTDSRPNSLFSTFHSHFILTKEAQENDLFERTLWKVQKFRFVQKTYNFKLRLPEHSDPDTMSSWRNKKLIQSSNNSFKNREKFEISIYENTPKVFEKCCTIVVNLISPRIWQMFQFFGWFECFYEI